MHTIRIDINNSIYEHIMFFLKNLPSNLVNIHLEKEEEQQIITSKKESLRGVFKSHSDSNKQPLEKEAWKNHLLQKHKTNLDD